MDYLPYELHRKSEHSSQGQENDYSHPIQGRVLIIEDLTVNVIELLGSELDIDPLFFAMHLHTVQRTGMRHQMPDEATLPSRLRSNDYINVSYHRPVICDNTDLSGGKWVRDTAVNRKVVLLRSTEIALASHSTSIIKVKRSKDFWIAIIIVDPALGATHFKFGHQDSEDHKVNLDLRPFLGSYEDFTEPPKFSEVKKWRELSRKPRGCLLDDIIQYWTREMPADFNIADPTLHSLAHYPLRIVAAEWVKYVEVMQYCIKLYEYKGNDLPDLAKFNMDLRELQGWRLRSVNSQQKVGSIIRKLKSQDAVDAENSSTVDSLIEDFEVINNSIQSAGQRLENMLPVVTSLVQIIDARQSFAETANISRLTVLALVFIPLSYVSSLYSMNSEIMPGSKHFWQYFAVAIPVTLIVFIIAKPPTELVEGIVARFQKVTQRKKIAVRTRNGKDTVRQNPEA
ncbi:hypothetical protein GQ44DRAFT_633179 [Phaeosphaeriaceae sp. PMI808]|nr:hypothetical protein GQ44DRAFT_633179 [Phaeosphaeriaceae sp. PMI808]